MMMADNQGSGAFLIIIQTILLLGLFVLIHFIYRYAFRWLIKKAADTSTELDDHIVRLLRDSLLWFIYWFLLNISARIIYAGFSFLDIVLQMNNLLLIFALTWLTVQFINAIAFYLQTRFDITRNQNVRVRKSLTQIKVFKAIIISIIIIVAIGAGLMTFESARRIGISILTSAGILGLIAGFAAQKSLGMIFAGIQLALTQPIRLDDLVIVEGEFGRVEEIELTYVVVEIWDERRMIVPVTWFLEKPFQNLTRTTTSATGTIFLFVDYAFPVEKLREVLPSMLRGNPNWDGRTANIQVTDVTENYKEVRILLSSANNSRNWDLRTMVREKLIDYINANFPDTFARIRIQTV
jgi:small-conductance mechanosensitive channel